jgi:hypothetical protein
VYIRILHQKELPQGQKREFLARKMAKGGMEKTLAALAMLAILAAFLFDT